MNLSSPGSSAPVDHWHNDSIAFAGVVVLSEMQGMQVTGVPGVLQGSWRMIGILQGGQLELFRGSKEEGKQILRCTMV